MCTDGKDGRTVLKFFVKNKERSKPSFTSEKRV